MLPPNKPKPKNRSFVKKPTTFFNGPDDMSPVNVGNKPKPKVTFKPKRLLTDKGLVMKLNLRPTVPSTPPNKPYVIRVRDFLENKRPEVTKRPCSFTVKLDVPEHPNPFYATEKHRKSYIEEQLRTILTSLGLTYYGDIIFEEWVSLLEQDGWTVDLELQEAA